VWLRFKVFGVLDGADFDVGLFAGFVAAESGDPDLAVADHGSLRVDEEVFILLFEDGVGDVVGDDGVVVLDEGLLVFDHEGLLARVDLDRVVDEDGDSGRVVFGNAFLKLGEGIADPDVVADGQVDGFVECEGAGGLGLSGGEVCREESASDQQEDCELGADGHSISVKRFEVSCRGIGYTCLCKTLSTLYS
jgi:hypothetical protein